LCGLGAPAWRAPLRPGFGRWTNHTAQAVSGEDAEGDGVVVGGSGGIFLLLYFKAKIFYVKIN